MTEDLLKKAVMEALKLPESEFSETLGLGQTHQWDSLAHIGVIFAVEDMFSIQFDTDEIPKLRSVTLLREALAQRGIR